MKNYLDSNKITILSFSILLGFILCFSHSGLDDKWILNRFAQSGMEAWDFIVMEVGSYYQTWSSRIIFNSCFHIFLLYFNRMLWPVFMVITTYVFVKSSVELVFGRDVKKHALLFSLFVFCLIPLRTQYSAGWIATTCTYYGPIAFMLTALIPIRKIYENKSFSIKEWLLYIFSVIYSCNFEQCCMLLLCAYLIASAIQLISSRKISPMIAVLLLLSAASAVFIQSCPGNAFRFEQELINWFPDYGMLSAIDKLDLGFFRTLSIVFFKYNNTLVIALSVLLFIGIKNKYPKERTYKYASLLIILLLVLLGPLHSPVRHLPVFEHLVDIPYYGVIGITTEYWGVMQSVIYTMIFLTLLIEILLVCKNLIEFLVCTFFYIIGLGTGVAIGLTPTIYASSYRVFEVFYACIMLVAMICYRSISVQGLISENRLVKNIPFYYAAAAVYLIFAAYLSVSHFK